MCTKNEELCIENDKFDREQQAEILSKGIKNNDKFAFKMMECALTMVDFALTMPNVGRHCGIRPALRTSPICRSIKRRHVLLIRDTILTALQRVDRPVLGGKQVGDSAF